MESTTQNQACVPQVVKWLLVPSIVNVICAAWVVFALVLDIVRLPIPVWQALTVCSIYLWPISSYLSVLTGPIALLVSWKRLTSSTKQWRIAFFVSAGLLSSVFAAQIVMKQLNWRFH